MGLEAARRACARINRSVPKDKREQRQKRSEVPIDAGLKSETQCSPALADSPDHAVAVFDKKAAVLGDAATKNKRTGVERDLAPKRLGEANEFIGDLFDSLGVFLSLMRSPREAKSLLASFSADQITTMETRHQ